MLPDHHRTFKLIGETVVDERTGIAFVVCGYKRGQGGDLIVYGGIGRPGGTYHDAHIGDISVVCQ